MQKTVQAKSVMAGFLSAQTSAEISQSSQKGKEAARKKNYGARPGDKGHQKAHRIEMKGV